MNEFAQCLTNPSPSRCASNRFTSLQIIIACEFLTIGKYAISFFNGSVFNHPAIFVCVAVIIGCSRLYCSGWYTGDGLGLSIRSTTASSISRSISARMLASRCWPSGWGSFSSSFTRAREDREARERRTMAMVRTEGMRRGKSA